MTHHFVYVYVSTSEYGNRELQWSIQSIRKYFKEDFKIFVFGTNPKVSKIHFVSVPQVRNKKFAKAIDSYVKLKAIAEHPLVNDKFIYMHDDMVFLRPFTFSDLNFSMASDYVKSLNEYVKAGKAGKHENYRAVFCNTMNLLKKKKLPRWNYETHCPKVFEKKKVLEIIEKYGLLSAKDVKTNKPYLFNSLYFNTFEKAPFDSLMHNNRFHQGFYSPFDMNVIERCCKNKLLLNFNDNGLSRDLQKFIYNKVL